jgi:hypothetical protein
VAEVGGRAPTAARAAPQSRFHVANEFSSRFDEVTVDDVERSSR